MTDSERYWKCRTKRGQNFFRKWKINKKDEKKGVKSEKDEKKGAKKFLDEKKGVKNGNVEPEEVKMEKGRKKGGQIARMSNEKGSKKILKNFEMWSEWNERNNTKLNNYNVKYIYNK